MYVSTLVALGMAEAHVRDALRNYRDESATDRNFEREAYMAMAISAIRNATALWKRAGRNCDFARQRQAISGAVTVAFRTVNRTTNLSFPESSSQVHAIAWLETARQLADDQTQTYTREWARRQAGEAMARGSIEEGHAYQIVFEHFSRDYLY